MLSLKILSLKRTVATPLRKLQVDWAYDTTLVADISNGTIVYSADNLVEQAPSRIRTESVKLSKGSEVHSASAGAYNSSAGHSGCRSCGAAFGE